ncbi:GNAT family N-acetyltransferase [Streptomyces sp. ODS28]|uniref:GNAT family N-acetyltransferase n=1 Tax=Streptomyces sp. ODS28 TaxID=3136688 RepID=UPI0031E57D99
MLRALQERVARALPAEEVAYAGEWRLRAAPESSWWVGTAQPHGPVEDGALGSRIAAAEKFYAERGAVTRFQITPGVCPRGLDAELAARGYRWESPVSLQTAPTARVRERVPEDGLSVRVDTRPSQDWFAVWHAAHGGDPAAERAMIARVREPSAYARVLLDGEAVAVGRAVAEGGWAGVFSMATLPRACGRGAARRVLAALAEWAEGAGAETLYLQVTCENAAALRLYARTGFEEVCTYHYRTAAPH